MSMTKKLRSYCVLVSRDDFVIISTPHFQAVSMARWDMTCLKIYYNNLLKHKVDYCVLIQVLTNDVYLLAREFGRL